MLFFNVNIAVVFSMTSMQLDFDKMDNQLQKKVLPSDPDEFKYGPTQESFKLPLTQTQTPICFDGTHLIVRNHESKATWNLEVYDWKDERKLLKTIKVRMSGLTALVPTNIMINGDDLFAVINDKTLTCWSVSSGEIKYKVKASSAFVSMEVCVRATKTTSAQTTQNGASTIDEAVVVSVHRDSVIRIHKKGVLAAAHKLPNSMCQFNLGIGYMLRSKIVYKTEDNASFVHRVFFNDDTGIHMAELEQI